MVDDEEFCLTTVKVLLKKAGVDLTKVDFCIDGREALNKIINKQKKEESYSIILTDFNMPNLDGIAATKKIR